MNFMKKNKSLIFKILFIISLIIVTLILPLRTKSDIFLITDKKGDDYGDGNIKYPTYLKDYSNIFDLREFKIKDKGEFYDFNIKMTNIVEDAIQKNGFSHLLLDIFINADDSGMIIPLEYGPVVTFDTSSPWKYHIRISPTESYFEYFEDMSKLKTTKIDCNVIINNNILSMEVPKEYILEDLKLAKYYIFSAGHDLFGPNEYRIVGKDEAMYQFYGGIDSLQQPNIIDTFNQKQEKLLAFFIPPNYVEIYPVYMIGIQKYLIKEYVYIFITGLSLILLYGEYKKCKKV